MTSSEMIKGFLENVDQGHGSDWGGLVVFEHRTNRAQWAQIHLDQLIAGGSEFNRQHNLFRWKSHERLFLGVIRDVNDYWSYHGHAYPYMVIAWETPHWPSYEITERLRCIHRPRVPELEPFMKVVSVTD